MRPRYDSLVTDIEELDLDPAVTARGYPPERTFATVVANAAEHVVVGLGVALVGLSASFAIWLMVRWVSGYGNEWEYYLAPIAVILLAVTGAWAVWSAGQDEWLRRHDRHAWDVLQLRLFKAKDELQRRTTEFVAERSALEVVIANYEQDLIEANREIGNLRKLLTHGGKSGTRYVRNTPETAAQVVGQRIIARWRAKLPYSRDVMVKEEGANKNGWEGAFYVWKKAGLAHQRGPGGAWTIKDSATEIMLLNALEIRPDTTLTDEG